METHEVKSGEAIVIAGYTAPAHTNHVPGKCLTSVFARLDSELSQVILHSDLVLFQIRVNGELRIPKNTPFFGNASFSLGPICIVTCIPLHSDETVQLVILNQCSKTPVNVSGGLGIVDFVES